MERYKDEFELLGEDVDEPELERAAGLRNLGLLGPQLRGRTAGRHARVAQRGGKRSRGRVSRPLGSEVGSPLHTRAFRA